MWPEWLWFVIVIIAVGVGYWFALNEATILRLLSGKQAAERKESILWLASIMDEVLDWPEPKLFDLDDWRKEFEEIRDILNELGGG